MAKTATEAQLGSAAILPFILAGKALFTLRSVKSGVRYTFKMRLAKETDDSKPQTWFVSLLTGPDNWTNYSYMGIVQSGKFRTTTKTKISGAPVAGFQWFFDRVVANKAIDGLEVWHAGHCGRCGRTLTVPESIEAGFGPECAGLI
jgi:hypothetical protein